MVLSYFYGQTIATGGSSRSNRDVVARSSQSHNLVLINGQGQSENEGNPDFPNAGRILSWKEKRHTDTNGPDFVHLCSDLRNAYLQHRQHYLRHFMFVCDRHFVVYDDLALLPQAQPALFSCLPCAG